MSTNVTSNSYNTNNFTNNNNNTANNYTPSTNTYTNYTNTNSTNNNTYTNLNTPVIKKETSPNISNTSNISKEKPKESETYNIKPTL